MRKIAPPVRKSKRLEGSGTVEAVPCAVKESPLVSASLTSTRIPKSNNGIPVSSRKGPVHTSPSQLVAGRMPGCVLSVPKKLRIVSPVALVVVLANKK